MNLRKLAQKLYNNQYVQLKIELNKNIIKSLRQKNKMINNVKKYVHICNEDIINFFKNDFVAIKKSIIHKHTDFENDAHASINHYNDKKDQMLSNDDLDLDKISNTIKLDDPVKMYLKEIGQIPLLTLDEEKKQSKIVYEGIQAKTMLEKHNNQEITLSSEEIKNNQLLIAKGEIAKSKLVEANYRLVVSIAKRYIGKKILFLDLIQEGNMGLMRAVDKFDYTKGFKFSTYATWWIRQAITRAVSDKCSTIRVPVHIREAMNKISRFRGKMTQDLSRKVDNRELAAEMNMDVKQIIDIQMIEKETISLEATLRDDDDSSLGDFVNDPNTISPHEYMLREMLKQTLEEILEETLTDRTEQILKMRFGLLPDGHIYTLEEIGKKFGVTRERIRQIEVKALRRLRSPSKQNKLKMIYHNLKKK
ncbi:MAG: sigma-70 family RNA polymerase sigma factor [Vigna little leaf phytoplasma]|nr:sigma-70 family RNA polymerase sigma factor [Vigna little leaf phytoplasma]